MTGRNGRAPLALVCHDSRVEEEWIRPPAVTHLLGDEQFVGCAASVVDFWRFAMSDLRTNNVRGYLAEFLVAKAVGAQGSRLEWDAYDVLAPDGTTIEVKSSAYLQVWDQRRPSRIVFSGLRGRTWTPQDGEASEATYNADVYVFAVQTAQRHDEYNPLDVGQWLFYVLPRAAIEAMGYKSVSLPTLLTAAGTPTPYPELAGAIARAAAANASTPFPGAASGSELDM